MDYAFVKEDEWETATNAEVTIQGDKKERCIDAHRRVSVAQCCIALGRGLRFNSARGIFPLSHFYDMMMKRLSHLSR